MPNNGEISVLQPEIGTGTTDIIDAIGLALGHIDALSHQTATGYTGYDPVDGFAIDFTGIALTYNAATGAVTGGTISSFTIRNSDGVMFVANFAPGLSAMSLSNAAAAYAASGFTNSAALDTLFNAYGYTFNGNADDETFVANPAGTLADTLFGGVGNDTLNGGGGNDYVVGGAGADKLDGGIGTGDTVSYENAASEITINLGQTSAQGTAEGDTILNFENVTGTDFNDYINATDAANIIIGGKGADQIIGQGGIDTIFGGDGNDDIYSGLGADILDGGADIDYLIYSDSTLGVTLKLGEANVQTAVTGATGGTGTGDKIKNFENVLGSFGNDKLTGNSGNNNLNGFFGNDILFGGAGDDSIDGNDGNDIVEGGAGADILGGGDGIDTLSYASSLAGVTIDPIIVKQKGGDAEGDQYISGGFEILIGSGKDDVLNVITGGNNDIRTIDGGGGNDFIKAGAFAEIDTLSGGSGNDLIFGLGEADTIDAGLGDDVVEGGAGADTLKGGTGIDTLSYASETNAVTVTLKGALAADVSFAGNTGTEAAGDVATGFENIRGGSGADVLTGDNLANIIEGGAGADKLFGGAKDFVSYANDPGGVIVNLAIVKQTSGISDETNDELNGFQNLIGSSKNDSLRGNGNANIIMGGGGDDTIFADLGADTLDGGDGLSDTVSYQLVLSTKTVTVTLGAANVQTSVTGNGAEATGDKIKNFENVLGGDGNDILTGNAAANIIQGRDGGDIIQGGAGADILDGGTNSFPFNDTVTYAASLAGVTIDLSLATQVAQAGDASGDKISNFEILIGSAKNDILVGRNTASDDTIFGGAGDDVIEGRGGNGIGSEALDGGAGNDTASYATSGTGVTVDLTLQAIKGFQSGGDAGTDILTGFENLVGSGQADLLAGDSGANIIEGGALGDTLDGKLGIDTLSYEHSINAVTVGLVFGLKASVSGGDAASDIAINFENLTGSAKNDQLFGDTKANVISGGGGSDQLSGGDGDDKLLGGDGIDILSGGNDKDNISGGADNDVVQGGAGADMLDGGDGLDILQYAGTLASQSITVTFGEANVQKTVTATAGSDAAGDKIKNFEHFGGGGSAKYVVTGNSEANSLETNSGNDVLKGMGGDDILDGSNGNDVLDGGVGNDTIFGGIDNDTILGGTGDDQINGGDGDDVLEGGVGADTLTGGNGIDTASYAASALGVTVVLNSGFTQSGDAQGDILGTQIENILGSAKNDALTGSGVSNSIAGGAGDDEIQGLGGVADTLDGGAGIDTVLYTSSANGIVVDLTLQTAKTAQSGGTGDSVGDILTGFENVVGSDQADTIIGDSKNNIIEGGKLGDTLSGGTGIDTVSYKSSLVGVSIDLVKTGAQGGAGDGFGDILSGFENIIGSEVNDTLTGDNLVNTIFGGGDYDIINGGNGADVLDGGEGFDYLDYALMTGAQSATVTLGAAGVQTTVTGTAGSIAAGDKIKNFEGVFGGAGNDVLTGNAAYNEFNGGDGNDILTGGAGGDGLNGGNGIDTVMYATSLTGVTVNLKSGGPASGGDAEGDFLSAMENVTGSAKNDTITGSDLVNKILGGLGDDVIEGGKLGDTLDGGTGIDTVSYSSSLIGVTIDLALQASKGAQTDGDAAGDVLTGFENIIGSAGIDKLTGDTANNVIEGGDGADILDGGKGTNTLSYVHDTSGVNVSLLAGTATGGDASGDSFLNFLHLTGGSGNDFLTGNALNNNITGGLGDDVLAPGIDPLPLTATGGVDVLDGGGGFDTVSFGGATLAATINLAAGTAKIGASTHTLKAIEAVRGGDGNDVFSALGFNSASKNAGSIGAGNPAGDFNRFEGGKGNDSILGNGNTQVSYALAGDGVSVDLLAGTAASINVGDAAQIGVDSFVGGVNAIQGSNFADILRGSDILDAETFEGLSGNDDIDGNGGFDRADYSQETGNGISVDLAAGIVNALAGGSSGSDALTQIEAIRGTDFDDTINTNGFTDSSANPGDLGTFNEVEGGGGNDFIVGNANTRIAFYHSNTAVTVDLSAQSATGDGSANDNVGTDTINAAPHVRGSQFNDTIIGNNFSNTLDGQLGDDTLTGLTFGGDDTFVYSVGLTGEFIGGGKDTIMDFQVGTDMIDLHVANITSYADVRALMTETVTGVDIDFGGGNSLILMGQTIANLDAHQSDFLFI